MTRTPQPTRRELAILQVLWDRGEATVRQVHEALAGEPPIVQNTVQAFLRTMEEKGFVTHRLQGRSFVYRPVLPRRGTGKRLLSGLLERVFDNAMDQLVESAFSLRKPTPEELRRLKELLRDAERRSGR